MGYVHTKVSKWIPPNKITADVGTHTLAVASNVWSLNKTAADTANVYFIPIEAPSSELAANGYKLESIEIMYSIVTAAADAVSAVLVKDAFQASGTLNTAAAVTTTYDAAHDTAPERITVDEHRLVLTVSSPAFTDNDEGYHAELTVDGAATTVVKVFGAIANYTLRL